MITISSDGSTDNIVKFLKAMQSKQVFQTLSRYGQVGCDALSSATPRDSGLTAESWTFEIVQNARYWGIIWHNTNLDNGRPVAIMLQYGHGTKNGGYVNGKDYINPAIKPVFDKLADDAWKGVTAL